MRMEAIGHHSKKKIDVTRGTRRNPASNIRIHPRVYPIIL